MARTQGHGNPDWTRDETILALDLYLSLAGERVRSSSPEIQELSAFLRSLPYHATAAKKPTFRNPPGVAFKLQNIRQIATGKGLENVSKTDRTVWSELGHQPDEVRVLAKAIRAGAIALSNELDDDDEEFSEGKVLTALHRKRERARGIRKRLLDSKRGAGLRCEICTYEGEKLPRDLLECIFEAHHLVPLAELGERKTRLSDLSLLCASCHRVIHRLIARDRHWYTIAEARIAIAHGVSAPG